ncbi:MAG: DNA adenine methylase [Acholeplasmatales bacterium]|jgi:DNA adenine methylase|nr:DNA adenine methylase [Acholeplasmatales bacterium]
MAKNKLVMPVVKWVGGKRQLFDEIKSCIPKTYKIYYEPFFGGGAVLFALQPKKAVINDLNDSLIKTYKVIKENTDELIASLSLHENTSDYFYEIRNEDLYPETFNLKSDVEVASRLIYLNKTCFNGLFRVNSAGHFNTPFGNYKKPNIVNEPVIRAVSKYFNDNEITILNGDFAIACQGAQKGDFVYLDPPYDPVSDTASFTGYNAGGFGSEEQIRLRDLCIELDKRGVKFLLSNSATQFIMNLYKSENFKNKITIDIVKAKRSINSNGNKRGEVDEVLIRNY